MSVAAIDTPKIVKQFQDAGFSKKQATAVTEVLAEVVSDLPSKDAVIEAMQDVAIGINLRLEATDRRLSGQIEEVRSEVKELRSEVKELRSEVNGLRSEVNGLRSEVNELRSEVNELRSEVGELRSEVQEVKTSVAVINQNQLETNRSIQAIMAHLGIPKV